MIWPFKSHDHVMVQRDADALVARYGDGAYGEARERAADEGQGVIVDGNRSSGHWQRVRRKIGRMTGRDGLDSATRREELR